MSIIQQSNKERTNDQMIKRSRDQAEWEWARACVGERRTWAKIHSSAKKVENPKRQLDSWRVCTKLEKVNKWIVKWEGGRGSWLLLLLSSRICTLPSRSLPPICPFFFFLLSFLDSRGKEHVHAHSSGCLAACLTVYSSLHLSCGCPILISQGIDIVSWFLYYSSSSYIISV